MNSMKITYLEQSSSQSLGVQVPHRGEPAVASDPSLSLELALPTTSQEDGSQAEAKAIYQL